MKSSWCTVREGRLYFIFPTPPSQFLNLYKLLRREGSDCMTLACSEVLFSLCICLVSWQLLELNEDMNYFGYAQPQLFVCECLLKLMNAPASAKLRKSREGRSTSGLAIIEWDIKSSRLLGCIQIITAQCLFVKFHKLPNPGPGTGSWLWRCDREWGNDDLIPGLGISTQCTW